MNGWSIPFKVRAKCWGRVRHSSRYQWLDIMAVWLDIRVELALWRIGGLAHWLLWRLLLMLMLLLMLLLLLLLTGMLGRE